VAQANGNIITGFATTERGTDLPNFGDWRLRLKDLKRLTQDTAALPIVGRWVERAVRDQEVEDDE